MSDDHHKLMVGKLMFDTDAHMMAGQNRLTFSRDKGVFFWGVEVPDLPPVTIIAPIDEAAGDHRDDRLGRCYKRFRTAVPARVKCNCGAAQPKHTRNDSAAHAPERW